MRVYRYERNGYGPYTYRAPDTVQDERLNKKLDVHEGWSTETYEKWPTADWDRIPSHMAIGCPTLKHLLTWFDGVHGSLVRCGFRIRVFEIPADRVVIGESGKQVGFNHGWIERVIL